MRPHMPFSPGRAGVVDRGSTWPEHPSAGQRQSATGRNDIITSSVQAIPMADTGPRLLLELSSEKLRHSRPMITVAPDAKIAGADSFHALIIASKRLA